MVKKTSKKDACEQQNRVRAWLRRGTPRVGLSGMGRALNRVEAALRLSSFCEIEP
jgi:hypothetical protein